MASLKRAIDRGIDYRREMELEEAGGSSAVAAGRELLEGVVSRERYAYPFLLLMWFLWFRLS